MPGAYMPPQNPPKKDPAPTDPTRHQFDQDPHLGTHQPYEHPDASTSPTVDSKIKVTQEQLLAWSKLFDDAALKLNLVGDSMTKIKVQPGYFTEANTIRDLVSTFNSTFIPNSRILSDSSSYVSRALQLVSKEFDNVEKANLDKNANLTDTVSSLTKLETGLKPTAPITPNTPPK
jgi:hypothetical protein